MTEYVVEVSDLVKVYPGGVKGVDGISFVVRKGEVYGLIGPNGAGKTTTLRILATILQPTSGRALVYGYDVVRDAPRVREIISYLPEEAGAYKYLSGFEFLEFIAEFYAGSEEEKERMLREGVALAGLGKRIRDKIKSYSKGMLRRLLVAKTLMVHPKLAILDEPTSGLDVVNAVKVREAIRKYVRERGVTVLLSSHNMLEVEYLCDCVAIIHKGRIVAEGEPRKLVEEHGVSNLEEVFVKLVGGEL